MERGGLRLLCAVALLGVLAPLATVTSASAAVGDVTVFPLSVSFTSGIVLGPDGNFWVGVSNDGLVKVSTAGEQLAHYSVTQADQASPAFLTRGVDGALWFAERGSDLFQDYVARITPSGMFEHWPIPNSKSAVEGLTLGPDGAIWVTASSPQLVFRVAEDGTMTTFSPPTNVSLGSIVSLGGALWFTAGDATAPTTMSTLHVAKMTTSGAWTTYPTGTLLAYGIVAGGDGNLWGSDAAHSKVFKMTREGVITTFDAPTANSEPEDLTLGPDGNVWFLELPANTLARITPAGVMTEFAIPGSPGGLASGADGNLWMTLNTHPDEVGRLTLKTPPAPLVPITASSALAQPAASTATAGVMPSPAAAPTTHPAPASSATPAATDAPVALVPTVDSSPSAATSTLHASASTTNPNTFDVSAQVESAASQPLTAVPVDFSVVPLGGTASRVGDGLPQVGVIDASAADCIPRLTPAHALTNASGRVSGRLTVPAACGGSYLVTAAFDGVMLNVRVAATAHRTGVPTALVAAAGSAVVIANLALVAFGRRRRRARGLATSGGL